MFTSFLMVVLTLSKTLMPQKFSRKTSLAEKVKNIVWALCISNILGLVVLFNLILTATVYTQDTPLVSPSQLKLFFIISGISIAILILTYLSMNIFCGKYLQNINRKCLNISIFIFLYQVHFWIIFFTIVLSTAVNSSFGSGFPIMISGFFISNFFVIFVFTKAAFIVSRVRDIWSLDVMTKKQLCPIPNMLLSSVVLLNVASLALLLLSGNSIFYG